MKKNSYVAFLFVLLISANAFAGEKTWFKLNSSEPVKCIPTIQSLAGSQSEVEINLPGFFSEEKITPRGNAFSISFPGGVKMLETGMPDLPQISFSLAIPDNVAMNAEIISSDYIDVDFSIAPSKGNLKRDQDPSLVPYSYSSQYAVDAFYPSSLTVLQEPYILRDFRGQTVVVRPFEYNPVTQQLRIYFSIKIRVSPVGTDGAKNVLQRRASLNAVDATFASIYKTHFLNASSLAYTPVNEHGNMLVIADPSLMSTMQPFVDWKNRMGQKTEMVDVSTIGINSTDIKTYIDNNNGRVSDSASSYWPQVVAFSIEGHRAAARSVREFAEPIPNQVRPSREINV